jgi:hypothetical protein
MSLLSFSPNNQPGGSFWNKIMRGIAVYEKKTLYNNEADSSNGTCWGWAIADDPFVAKVDGKKFFCVQVVTAPNEDAMMMIGLTKTRTFESSKHGCFTVCALCLFDGTLVGKQQRIIDRKISNNAKEIITILTIGNNGTKKEIRFLVDGVETKSTDVSEILDEDYLYPALSIAERNQTITTISIDEIKTRTPEIENLIKEYQEEQNNKNNDESGDGAVASPPSPAAILLEQEKQRLEAENKELKEKEDQLQHEKKVAKEKLRFLRAKEQQESASHSKKQQHEADK